MRDGGMDFRASGKCVLLLCYDSMTFHASLYVKPIIPCFSRSPASSLVCDRYNSDRYRYIPVGYLLATPLTAILWTAFLIVDF